MTAALLAVAAALVLAAGRRPPPRRDTPAVTTGGTARTRVGTRARHDPAVRWDRFLDAVAAEVRGGASLRFAVLDTAARRCPHHVLADPATDLTRPPSTTSPDLAIVWQTLIAAATFGGATAATVQAGANLLRERASVMAEAMAHSAQARLSARVLTGVPLGFAGWSAAVSPTFRHALLSPPGMAAAALGLGLNVVGWWWMRRTVRAAAA